MIENIPKWASWVIFLGALVGVVYGLSIYYPIGIDWEETYSQLSDNWSDPYSVQTFTNPPWVILLLPHALLPIKMGNAVNFLLNLVLILAVIRKFGGDWKTILLVFTSPVFFDLARTNNVSWVPMLALLLPYEWALPVLAIKPHTIGGAALIWWKKRKFSIKMIIPVTAVAGLSLWVWGWWPSDVGLVSGSHMWNFSPWPVGIPLGLYMLYRGYINDDEFMAAAATPFLTPYIAPYSIAGVLAYVGCKYKKETFFVYIGFWSYAIIEARRLSSLILDVI